MTQPINIIPPLVSEWTYRDALTFIDELDVSVQKLGLERMQKVLSSLSNPQDKIPAIHIAGTNGKGSTTAMLASVLQEAGYKVGRFTSPHLMELRERICIQGEKISERELTQLSFQLKQHLEQQEFPKDEWPTHFEFITLLAMVYFLEQKVDIVVYETGLGGRLDATNVLNYPLVSVITGIDYDHTERLGPTLTAIAGEKAGIIKPTVPVVVGPEIPLEALQVIQQKAETLQVAVIQTAKNRFDAPTLLDNGCQKILDSKTHNHYELALLGPYQVENAATVITVVEVLRNQGWSIPNQSVEQGLQQVVWPGRFQYVSDQQLLLDGSHNQQGLNSLALGLNTYFADRPLYWMVSLLSNREPALLLDLLAQFPQTHHVIWTVGSDPKRYHDPVQMAQLTQEYFPQYSVEAITDSTKGLEKLMQVCQLQPESLGVVTGSLYTVGQVLEALDLKK